MYRFFIIALFVCSVPFMTHANTNETLVAQIQQLLQQIEILKSQLAERQGGAGANTCVSLDRNLWLGTEGSDVRSLQNYLKTTGDYTYPEVTGYYGKATEAAVQRWQQRQGVVSGGTPETTGYGSVGPKTRSALANSCTQSVASTDSVTLSQTQNTELVVVSEKVGDVCRNIEGQDIDVDLFGANPKDALDDSLAIQAAFDCLVDKNKKEELFKAGSVHFSAGTYTLNQRISLEDIIWHELHALSVSGAGSDKTTFTVNNMQGGFLFDFARVGMSVTIADMQFVPMRANVGAALEMTVPDQGSTHHNQLVVRDVEINTAPVSSSYYFSHGVKTFGVHRPIFRNVHVKGATSGLGKHAMNSCLWSKESYSPLIDNSSCQYAQYGFQYVSDKLGGVPGPEGGMVSNSSFLDTQYGIYVKTNSIEPGLYFVKNIFRNAIAGIKLDGRKFFSVIKNEFSVSDTYARGVYRDIELNAAKEGVVNGNTFYNKTGVSKAQRHFVELNDLRIPMKDGSIRTWQSENIVIADNTFGLAGVPVTKNGGTSNILIKNNN